MLRRSVVRAEPSNTADRVGVLGLTTYLGSAEVVLVLGTARSAETGEAWSFVRFPGEGDTTGWVPATRHGPLTYSSARLVIDRRRRIAVVWRRGRVLLRAPIAVGTRSTPTPAGRTYVRERVVPDEPRGPYGRLALGLGAYSQPGTEWPGGGQVGVHGTNRPQLVPGRVTHGCVRLVNADMRRLGRWVTVGTPVEIR